ncbi:hypothetical protein BS17DRAFT_712036, partial [Gyrodon lividus]
KELYETSLLIFHIYCNLNGIAASKHCPISHTWLIAFLASYMGAYSGSVIANHMSTIHTWHLLHGFPWNVNHNKLKVTLQGASKLTRALQDDPNTLP